MRLVICLNKSRVRTTSQYLALSSCAYIPLLFARRVIVLGGKGIINAPPATLPSLHPDRDIIASRVSVSFQSCGRTRRGSQREGWCRARCRREPTPKTHASSKYRKVSRLTSTFGYTDCLFVCFFGHVFLSRLTWPDCPNCPDLYGRFPL